MSLQIKKLCYNLFIIGGYSMKIIDLNENGVKLISSTRKQIYLTLNDIKEVLKSNYILQNNTFKINNKELYLQKQEFDDFSEVCHYLKTHFEKENKKKKA